MVNIREWMKGGGGGKEQIKENDNNRPVLKPQFSQLSQQQQQQPHPQQRPQQFQQPLSPQQQQSASSKPQTPQTPKTQTPLTPSTSQNNKPQTQPLIPQPTELLKKFGLFGGRNTKKPQQQQQPQPQPVQPKQQQSPQTPQTPQQGLIPPTMSVSQQNLNRLQTNNTKQQQHVIVDKNIIRCQITYLDETIKSFDVDKNALGQHLINIVCEDLELIEKDYFSLTYRDANNMKFWLDHEKKIKTQLKGVVAVAQPVFNFEVKFYPPEPQLLQEEITRYLLTLQLRHDIMDGKLPCSFVTHALLGAYSVQAELGDYDAEIHGTGYAYLEGFFFAPQQSVQLLEEVARYHRDHKSQSPAEAEMHFLENAVKLAMYGVDLHNGKDSDGVDILLGVSASGLMVYRDHLRINRFAWPKILKISYKRNYFYLKLRAGEFEKYESTIGFRCPNHKAAKRLWKIAVEHHAFFRLREPEKPRKQLIPSFNQKFRYTGPSTYIQSRYRSVERQQPAFERSLSKRLTQSMDRGLASTTFQRPQISSKSIPDKIGGAMTDDEDEYVTQELPNVDILGGARVGGPGTVIKIDNRQTGPIINTNTDASFGALNNNNGRMGSGRGGAGDGSYTMSQVKPPSGEQPLLDRRYVQPPILQPQRTPQTDSRYQQPQFAEQQPQLPNLTQDRRQPPSQPTTPPQQQQPGRYVDPQQQFSGRQPSQPTTPQGSRYVQYDEPVAVVRQPSQPTTPQGSRYVQDSAIETITSAADLYRPLIPQSVYKQPSQPTTPQHRQPQYADEPSASYNRQPSQPTTPQGSRYVPQQQQQQQYANDQPTVVRQPSQPTTPQGSRYFSAAETTPAVRQPSQPTTPQGSRYIPQQQYFDEQQQPTVIRQPSQPTTPQGSRYVPQQQQQYVDEPAVVRQSSQPTTPQSRKFSQYDEQQPSSTTFKTPSQPTTPQNRRYAGDDASYAPQSQQYRSSDDEERSTSSTTRNLTNLIAGLKRDNIDGRRVGESGVAEPQRPPPPRLAEYNTQQPQRPPPPPPPTQPPAARRGTQDYQDDSQAAVYTARPIQPRQQQQQQQREETTHEVVTKTITSTSKSSSGTNLNEQQQQNMYVEKTIVMNTEVNHQDVLLRAIQIATALDPNLEVEKVEISTE